jgi:hypothetical protein
MDVEASRLGRRLSPPAVRGSTGDPTHDLARHWAGAGPKVERSARVNGSMFWVGVPP